MRPIRPILSVLAAVAIVAGAAACGSSSSSPSSSLPAATGAFHVPSSQLISSGKLTYCTDFPAPPQEMYTTSGQAEGSDIDTGNAVAKQLGLTPVYVNTNFDTIIEALQTGKCDLIITGIFITPPRQKQINFVPYFTAGQQLLAAKGNPQHLAPTYTALCGKTIATQIGDAELTTAQQFSKQCQNAGKPAIKILSSQKVDTALQQVTTGRAAAFFYDSPLIAYYVHTQPSQFSAAGPAIDTVLEGIGVTKSHQALYTAVAAAMKHIEANGQYAVILKKWGLQNTKVPTIP